MLRSKKKKKSLERGSFEHVKFNLLSNTIIIIVALLLTRFLILGAAVSLFELTKNVFDCRKFAAITAALFSINPASIFFSSCYTESLYSFCGKQFRVVLKEMYTAWCKL